MRLRSRNVLAFGMAGLILVGAGVALAQSQSPTAAPSASATPEGGKAKLVGRTALLDIVARRLGIPRARLDAALKDMALADVKWAEDNDFITQSHADLLRERINRGAKGLGRLGLQGLRSLGIGFAPNCGFLEGRSGRGLGMLTAASNYVGLSEREVLDALRSKTLAQVARDNGKTIDGLKAALRTAKKADLDAAVAGAEVTAAQANALLTRFDTQVDDIVNGIPPGLTELARRLGVPRPKLITAIKNSAIELVDKAVADGKLTKAQGDAIKQRIRSSPAWPLGKGIGRWWGPRRFGHGFGRDRFRFGRPGMSESEEVIGL